MSIDRNNNDVDDSIFEPFDQADLVKSKTDEELQAEKEMQNSATVIKKEQLEKVLDVNDLRNYNQEEYQNKKFREEWTSPDKSTLNDNFRDFINIPKISGNVHGFSDLNKIPSEKLGVSDKVIEISDVNEEIDENNIEEHTYSTVILNKNHNGDIMGIDVICKCGNRIRINFEFGDGDFDLIETKDIFVKDPTKDPSIISGIVSNPLMEAAEDFENDDRYNEELFKQFDNMISDTQNGK